VRVGAINDAPRLVAPSAFVLDEDAEDARLEGITVSDVDLELTPGGDADGQLQLELAVRAGALALRLPATSAAGSDELMSIEVGTPLSPQAGDGESAFAWAAVAAPGFAVAGEMWRASGAALRLRGRPSAINAALAQLRYSPAPDVNERTAAEVLSLTLSDFGNEGSLMPEGVAVGVPPRASRVRLGTLDAFPLRAAAAVPIRVAPVNDVPRFIAPSVLALELRGIRAMLDDAVAAAAAGGASGDGRELGSGTRSLVSAAGAAAADALFELRIVAASRAATLFLGEGRSGNSISAVDAAAAALQSAAAASAAGAELLAPRVANGSAALVSAADAAALVLRGSLAALSAAARTLH
jgi:hypothetical protein